MNWFRKKKQVEPALPPVITKIDPCEAFGHVWQDFSPYMAHCWNEYGISTIKIIEPYVCLRCHKRKDVELQSVGRYNIDNKSFRNLIGDVYDLYKDIIKPKAIVEDMINDAILVDKDKLNAYKRAHGMATETEKFELRVPGEREK